MTHDPGELLSRYFDDLVTVDELHGLQDWLRSSPDHRQKFVRTALLHDHLRGEFLARELMETSPVSPPRLVPPASSRRWRSSLVPLGLAAVCLALLVLLLEVGKTTMAASTELKRLIAAQETQLDRTYGIAVEDVPSSPRKRPRVAADRRPPKPPLDGAVLHVRNGNQFVLIRNMSDGQRFVTGSNGRMSWAVRPDGPVRVSTDLTRFNRDLPGHEHDVPLIQIEQGLARLQAAYDVELLPIERSDDPALGEPTGDEPPTRLLVAVKKRGYRGPQRVEITYVVPTGQIRQLRFVGMPYGPDHLTVRLSLEDERPLGSAFFEHASHHTPDRVVEEE